MADDLWDDPRIYESVRVGVGMRLPMIVESDPRSCESVRVMLVGSFSIEAFTILTQEREVGAAICGGEKCDIAYCPTSLRNGCNTRSPSFPIR